MLCSVAIVDCAHVHHIVHDKIIRTCHILLLVLAAPNEDQLTSFEELIIVQGNITAEILVEDQLQPP